LANMAKEKTLFSCSECSHESPKWLGKCPGCGAWNTLTEMGAGGPSTGRNRFASLAPLASQPIAIGDVAATDVDRTPTGIEEFDRVLGGGVVEGSIAMVGVDPCIGKSTLLLQAMDALERQGRPTLYVTGEESQAQVALRFRRLKLQGKGLRVHAETQLERIMEVIDKDRPFACVIDSIQTMYSAELSSAPGSVVQVRECVAHLTRLCKALGTAIFTVAHVTKEGQIAGPQTAFHAVDQLLMLTGDEHSPYRLCRAEKNRFGSVNELGVFAMTERGMQGVTNPSAIFLSNPASPVPGSSVVVTLEGTRPMLVEIQALLDAGGPSPRRLTVGLERDRLAMLLAVLHRHGGITTSDQDVFVNAVGGVRISEPATDLAVILALQSSLRGKPLPSGLACFGETGLAGEVRPSPRGQERLKEAAKLGFNVAIIPKANAPKKPPEGMEIHAVARVDEALDVLKQLGC
jgi:DNA repair protein RadA/Sms